MQVEWKTARRRPQSAPVLSEQRHRRSPPKMQPEAVNGHAVAAASKQSSDERATHPDIPRELSRINSTLVRIPSNPQISPAATLAARDLLKMRRLQKQRPLTSDASHTRRQEAIRRAYSAASLRRPEADPQQTAQSTTTQPHRPTPDPRIMALLHGPTPAYRPPPTPTVAMLRQMAQNEQWSTSRSDFCDPVLQRTNSAAYDTPYHPSTHGRYPRVKAAWWRTAERSADELSLSRQSSNSSLPGFGLYSGAVDGKESNLFDEGRRAFREQRGRCSRAINCELTRDARHR